MHAGLGMATAQRRWLLGAAWCAVALGVLFRVLASAQMDLWMDGVEYVEMGHSFSRWHDFLLPDGERMGRTRFVGPGYDMVGTFEEGGRFASVTYVIARTPLIQERKLPTHVTEMYD